MVLYYKVDKEPKWAKLDIQDIEGIKTTELWEKLSDWVDVVQIRYNRRNCVLTVRGMGGQRLLYDTLFYMSEVKQSCGTVEYYANGHAVWNTDLVWVYKFIGALAGLAWIVLCLLGVWQLPVWLVTVYCAWNCNKLLR